MRLNALIEALEEEFEHGSDTSFFALIRGGEFDPEGATRVLRLLDHVKFGRRTSVSRELVSMLVLMPILVRYNLWRLRESGADMAAVEAFQSDMDEKLLEIFSARE